MRILLADDEPLTVDAMEYMLRKARGEDFVIEKAYSGKEAVELSMNSRPDIVVMDMNMPGIDGMEAIRKIRQLYTDIHFLIVTAMEYFDYAVESVKIEEIDEYILKPLRKDVFLEAIDKVVKKIEAQKTARKKLLRMEEQLQMVIPVLEKNFIGTICMAEYGESYIQEFCSLFSLKGKNGYILMVEFGDREKGGVQNGIGSGIRGIKYYKEYCNYLKGMCDCIIGDIVRNRLVILVYGDFLRSDYDGKHSSIQLALKLLNQIEKSGNEASISIGRVYPVEQAKSSYDEARQAAGRFMDYTEDTKIYHIEDIGEEKQVHLKADDMERLLHFIRTGKRDKVLEEIHTMYLEIRECCPDENINDAKNRTLYLLAHVHEEFKKTDGSYIQTLEEIIKGSSVWELQKLCEAYIQNVMEQSSAYQEEKIESIIERANQYMLEHLSEKITLEEISKAVYLSEYYFSRLYKSMTGKNYSDQLLYLRMEKTKKLIRQRQYSVREISEMVGYPDSNYLSKVFKKYTGMTISEYKGKTQGM